jgi:CubicO group peptidase (beta-lactamase class C family)
VGYHSTRRAGLIRADCHLVVVVVAVNGKLVWAEGIGFADLEQCVPTSPVTKFRIGSTSKPLTATGAVLLYQEGRLNEAPRIAALRYVMGSACSNHTNESNHSST